VSGLLIFGDTMRSPALRHEIPVAIPDPFAYAERDGERYAFVSSLEVPRLRELEGLRLVSFEELGSDELIAQGLPWRDRLLEIALRACRRVGLEEASTPADFPLAVADHLRENGIRLRAEETTFERRRRVKTEVELAGIRRANAAAAAALDAIRAGLRRSGSVTSEELRADAVEALTRAGALVPDLVIVSHGPQTAVGHEPGHGSISPGEAIVVDLAPVDPESGCCADVTRTFCVGDPPAELVDYHRLCREALDLALAAIRPGVPGSEPHRVVCEFFAKHGHPTQLTKTPGEVLEDGFYHGLGHGIGLEVHESPYLGRNGEEIVAGDVLAVEPGLYRKGFGGVRLEDDVLVTEDGCEPLTDYPYDLAP
jgi:Xaa-Pro aminopeptidase